MFLCIPLQFINLFNSYDFCNEHFGGYPESIAPPFGKQTPISLENYPTALTQTAWPTLGVRWTKMAGLSFPDDSDWFRDGHVTNSGPMRCKETVVMASGTEAGTLSHWT